MARFRHVSIIMLLSLFVFACQRDPYKDLPFSMEKFIALHEIQGREGNLRPSSKKPNASIFMCDYYLVEGFEDTEYINHKIDSIICADSDWNYREKAYSYLITVLKKSSITNEKSLRERRKRYYQYSVVHDLLYEYRAISINDEIKKISFLGNRYSIKRETFTCGSK